MTTVRQPPAALEQAVDSVDAADAPDLVTVDEGAPTVAIAASTPLLAHEPALDGLRGLAVAAVLGYHASILDDLPGLGRWIGGGFLGVSAFFTLSGFLITTLLVAEHCRSGRISLSAFWSRRFRRLLPATLLTLTLVVVLAPLLGTDSQIAALPGETFSSLADLFNWHSVVGGSDYADAFATSQSPLKHMWSLSVEEQWYLLLPLVAAGVLRAARGSRVALGVVFGVLATGSAALMWQLGDGAYSNRAYLGTDTRLAEMAVGGMLALVLFGVGSTGDRPRRAPGRLASIALDVASLTVLVGGVVVWLRADLDDGWLYRGGFALHALGVAVVIAAAMQPWTVVNRLLALRPLAALGRISYGVYLLHWPVLLWLTPERLDVSPQFAPVLQFSFTIAAAALSYRLLEAPIRGRRMVLGWRRVAAPVAAFGVVAALVAILPTPNPALLTALDDTEQIRSASQLRNSDRMFVPTTTDAPTAEATSTPNVAAPQVAVTTTTAPPPGPVRLLFSGDSFAMSLIPGIRDLTSTRSDYSFINTAMVGCGFGRGGRNRGIGLNTNYSSECRQRDQWLTAAIGHLHPDVVVFAGGLWDVTDRRPPGFGWTHIGEPAYDLFLAAEIRHLVSVVSVEGAQIVWLNSPRWDPQYTPGNFMGRPPYPEADPRRTDRFNELLAQALAGLPNVRIVDLAGWLRAQPGGEFAPTVRNDGVHLTETTSAAAAAWLIPQLVDIGRATPVTIPSGPTAGPGDLTSPTTPG